MTHGRHIKVAAKSTSENLRSGAALRRFLEELVGELGMRCLGEPHIYEVEEEIAKLGVEPFEDEGGVSGIVVLSTSHCAIHTWPLRSYFVLDIYSCRDFETATAERVIHKYFAPCRFRITDFSHALSPDVDRFAEKANAFTC